MTNNLNQKGVETYRGSICERTEYSDILLHLDKLLMDLSILKLKEKHDKIDDVIEVVNKNVDLLIIYNKKYNKNFQFNNIYGLENYDKIYSYIYDIRLEILRNIPTSLNFERKISNIKNDYELDYILKLEKEKQVNNEIKFKDDYNNIINNIFYGKITEGFSELERKIYKEFSNIKKYKHKSNLLFGKIKEIEKKLLKFDSNQFNRYKDNIFLENIIGFIFGEVLKNKYGDNVVFYNSSKIDDYFGNDFITVLKDEKGFKVLGLDLTTSSSIKSLNSKGIDTNNLYGYESLKEGFVKTTDKSMPEFYSYFSTKGFSINKYILFESDKGKFDSKKVFIGKDFSSHIIVEFIEYFKTMKSNNININQIINKILVNYDFDGNKNLNNNFYSYGGDEDLCKIMVKNIFKGIDKLFDDINYVEDKFNEGLNNLF